MVVNRFIPRILALAGSTRRDSYNKKLVQIALEGAKRGGATTTYLDLRDIPMPLYDGDLEEQEGIPDNVRKLKELLYQHHGFLIASPEYNSSISGVLKNAIDWASRKLPEEEDPLACFQGKIATLMSTSPGLLGGLRGLAHVRAILSDIGLIVLPQQVAVGKAAEAFDPNGMLKDAQREASILKLGEDTARIAAKLYPPSPVPESPA